MAATAAEPVASDLPTAAPAPSPEPASVEPSVSETKAQPEEDRPSGPVGHITLDPSARLKKVSKSDRNPGPLKLAIYGLVGIAVLGSAGLFAANKFFGFDPRPAKVDSSVSKFMIESPEVVAHLDVKRIMESNAYKRSPLRQQLGDNPIASYIQDISKVTVALDEVKLSNPKFIAIVDLEREYREEFVANFFRDAQVEKIGGAVMHTDPRSLSKVPTAVCLVEPKQLLLGSPTAIRDVLKRGAHPKLYPRESELIATTAGSGKAASLGMFFDSLESAFSKQKSEADKQLKKLDKDGKEMMKSMMGDVGKTMDDVEYTLKNVRTLVIDLEVGDSIEMVTRAECGTKHRAKKISKIVMGMMDKAPAELVAAMEKNPESRPVVNGSVVESRSKMNPNEIPEAFAAQMPGF